MKKGWKESEVFENRAVKSRALKVAHERGTSPVGTQLPWRGSGGGSTPGTANLRLGSSVREALEGEMLLLNFTPTPRPPHAQLHDFVYAGGPGMPFRSHLSLAVGSLVFLQVLNHFLFCSLSPWPNLLLCCFLQCIVCWLLAVSLTRSTASASCLVHFG